MLPLRAAINKAKRENKPVRRENVRIAQNGATRALNLQVIPLKNLKERCYLVLFEEERRRTFCTRRVRFGEGAETQPAKRMRPHRRIPPRRRSRARAFRDA